MTLMPGVVVPLAEPGQWRVRRWLGEGSQGVVWELAQEDGAALALKWYAPYAATRAQRAVLEALVDRGAPSPLFLWPLQLVDIESHPGFGYVMPLRPDGYVGLVELLDGRVDAPLSVAAAVCMHLADAFLALHAQGLCYRDISFGNVFVEPHTGKPLICDNDNVGIDGVGPSAVLGTRRFMAPEIVRGEASPSSHTDLYALSVLAFYMLMVGHPLLGRRELDYPCMDGDAEQVLFGGKPVFVFDPEDASNRPVAGIHTAVVQNWGLYPTYVQELFVQAFTRGLIAPRNGRVRESVWRAAMARLRDSVGSCGSCGKENFMDDGAPSTCWACGRDLAAPVRLHLGSRRLVLTERTRVCRHHLVGNYDYDTVVGEMRRHPERPALWGLSNLSTSAWNVSLPGRDPVSVPPGRAATLVRDAVIDFGPVSGRVVA